MPSATKPKTKSKQAVSRQPVVPADDTPLEDIVWGAFAGDPMFLEAMKLGREYRESLRPKAKPKRKAANARARH